MITMLRRIVTLLAATTVLAASPGLAQQTLFSFEPPFDAAKVEARDVNASTVQAEGSSALRLALGHNTAWPGITLRAPGGRWDLSKFECIEIDVKNVGETEGTLACRVDNAGADGRKNCVTGHIKLKPGEAGVLKVKFVRKPVGSSKIKFFGMRGTPFSSSVSPRSIDPSNVIGLIAFAPRPKQDTVFVIDNIRASGSYSEPPEAKLDPDKFFPMIDEYGQYIHRDWLGKTHGLEDFAKHAAAEAADLARHPGPKQWDEYGGWEGGPQLEAAGFFRPEKYEGKWWLVDPQGRLFWSHGADCVRPGHATTPITDRKQWYRGLPAPGTPFAQFYGRGSWAPHGYYMGKRYETYDFSSANLLRKYGQDWWTRFTDVTHRRLRSWGMNTIANWSDSKIYLTRKTPYVVAIHFGGSRQIAGSKGYWRKFHDVFDPSFLAALRKRMAKEKGKSADDPWCIGYFVDNELGWGSDTSLAAAALASPPDQPAKKVFLDDLKAKYGSIDKLNAAWGASHASWDALLQHRKAPDVKKARADLLAFNAKIAEQYFRLCRQAVKEVAPNNLYLGCRFSNVNDFAARAAAKFCDVVSYNRYRYSVADLKPPKGVDRPIIIGEFHFGALDRGMFHTGLRATKDQNARAEAYASYVTGALKNPFIVGTHWFQYGDQATTGRGDGENYQIGFVDVCDTPYVETVDACRRVGYKLYETRMAGGQ